MSEPVGVKLLGLVYRDAKVSGNELHIGAVQLRGFGVVDVIRTSAPWPVSTWEFLNRFLDVDQVAYGMEGRDG